MKLAFYFAAPLLSFASPLILIPVIATRLGSPGWETYALGTATGAFLAIISELGWSLLGPQEVSGKPEAERSTLFWLSLQTKLPLVFVLTAPLLAASLILSENSTTMMLIGLGGLTSSLSSSWYFWGLSQPVVALVTESLPKLVGTLAAATLVWVSGDLVWVGVCALSATVFTLVAASQRVRRQAPFALASTAAMRELYVRQLPAIRLRVASGLYQAGTPTLVAFIAPASFAAFAAADRLLRITNFVFQALPSSQQADMGAASNRGAYKLARRYVIQNSFLGAVGGLAFATVGLPMQEWLFRGEVDGSPQVFYAAGAAVFFSAMARSVSHVWLVRLDKIRDIEIATYVGASTFLLLLTILAPWHGAFGAMTAVAVGELSALAVVLAASIIPRSDNHDQ